ncbi:uncharacterized protein LOC119734451 [Patiria miniata]|uniref:Ciliary neurotrophic factor n=1 Tax=Patiria miniata TaxID=46514 RepID=A0A914AKE2_PATMI|nr:uncharacterized protein LOC119734451 [Patiria miniata]
MFPAGFSVCLLTLTCLCLLEMPWPTSALPLHRLLAARRPSRSVSALKRHASHMATEAATVVGLTDSLHLTYMSARFNGDRTIRSDELTAPSIELPSTYTVAAIISDTEIVRRHYDNLRRYKQVLHAVGETESEFSQRIGEVVEDLDQLIVRVGQMHELFNQSIGNSQPEAVGAYPQNTERNTRTLFVLQEFKTYMSQVVDDYVQLSSHL